MVSETVLSSVKRPHIRKLSVHVKSKTQVEQTMCVCSRGSRTDSNCPVGGFREFSLAWVFYRKRFPPKSSRFHMTAKETRLRGVLSLPLTLRSASADESVSPSLRWIQCITSQDGEEPLQNSITKDNSFSPLVWPRKHVEDIPKSIIKKRTQIFNFGNFSHTFIYLFKGLIFICLLFETIKMKF